jgi:hypothetical protein
VCVFWGQHGPKRFVASPQRVGAQSRTLTLQSFVEACRGLQAQGSRLVGALIVGLSGRGGGTDMFAREIILF